MIELCGIILLGLSVFVGIVFFGLVVLGWNPNKEGFSRYRRR